jgi:hypothetical protein
VWHELGPPLDGYFEAKKGPHVVHHFPLFVESRASVSTPPDASEPADRGRGTWRRRPASGWGWRS